MVETLSSLDLHGFTRLPKKKRLHVFYPACALPARTGSRNEASMTCPIFRGKESGE